MRIDVENTQAIKGLRDLRSKVDDMESLMRQIAGLLADITEEAFQGEYDPSTGEGWAGLLPATINKRTRDGTWPGSILQESGQLAASIVTDFGADFAEIGTNKVYATGHQFGIDDYPDRSGELEARPFIGLSEHDVAEIEKMITAFLSS